MPTWLEGPSVAAPAPVTLEVHQTEAVVLDASDSTQVPVKMAEDTATGGMETAQIEETTEVVHQETSAAPVASLGRENTVTPEADPVQCSTATDTVPEPCQEPLAMRDEESVPEMMGPVWEGAPVMLLQTTAGLDPYGGQQEEPDPTQEARDVSSMPGVHGSEQEERAGNEELSSVDSLEGQGSKGGDMPAETGTPHDESVHESTRDSSPKEEEADESHDPGSEPPESDNAEQEHEGPPDGETDRDGDGQASDGSRSDKDAPNNGDDQGGDQRREGDNTVAEGKDEGARPEDAEQQEAGAVQGQLGPVGGRPAHGAPTLPIRIMTRQEQARMQGSQYSGPCLLAGQMYPRVNLSIDFQQGSQKSRYTMHQWGRSRSKIGRKSRY